MSKRNLNGKQSAKNIGAQPPTRKHVNPDTGLVMTEKLCPIPYNFKAVDPCGNVVTVPLANGFVRDRTSSYGSEVENAKIAAGFLRYDVCPYSARGTLTGKKACEGSFSKDQCCKHITEITLARRKVKQDRAAKFALRFESGTDKMVRELQRQNGALAIAETDPKRLPGG